jgi:C-terminal processing protease CtpA/Prc
MRLTHFIAIAIAAPLLAQNQPPAAPKPDAAAPVAPSGSPTLSTDALLENLSSPDYETREQATTGLMTREDFNDDKLAAALRKSAGESRQRLIRIALHRYFARLAPNEVREDDTASLGVDISAGNIVRPEQNPLLKHPAMMISNTKPGFPAYVALRSGDLIIAVDGQSFDDNLDATDFSALIQRYKAGQSMTLDILRGGKKLTIKVKLDSLRRLNDVYQIQLTSPTADPALYGPWQQHLADLLAEAKPDPRITFPTK